MPFLCFFNFRFLFRFALGVFTKYIFIMRQFRSAEDFSFSSFPLGFFLYFFLMGVFLGRIETTRTDLSLNDKNERYDFKQKN